MGFGVSAFAQPADSLTTKVRNGKVFILHKVEKGQGLYGISRKYNVPIKEIMDANPGSGDKIQVDQVLYIPTGKSAPMEQPVVKDYFRNPDRGSEEVQSEPSGKATFARYHTVAKGETLFSIARAYGTKVDVIKSLNQLTDNELSIGQKLLVPSVSEETSKVENTSPEFRPLEPNGDEPLKPANAGNTDKNNTDVPAPKAYIGYETKTDYIKEFDVKKVWEKGMAEVREQGIYKKGKTASHHAAEIGSTIMVTNPETNEAVFVKVMGNHKLDEKRANIVILSPEAADKIGVKSDTVVEISFAH